MENGSQWLKKRNKMRWKEGKTIQKFSWNNTLNLVTISNL